MLLDEVVAVVEGQVITASTIEGEARLRALRSEGRAALERPLDAPALRAALDAMIDDLVVLFEAERLGVFGVSENEVGRACEQLRQDVGTELLERLGSRYAFTEDDLERVVRRELRVARYLEGRFLLASRPREADVRSHLEAEPARYEGKSPTAALELAREHLTRIRFEARIQEFASEARRRARVRVLRDPTRDGGTVVSGTVTSGEVGRRREASRAGVP